MSSSILNISIFVQVKDFKCGKCERLSVFKSTSANDSVSKFTNTVLKVGVVVPRIFKILKAAISGNITDTREPRTDNSFKLQKLDKVCKSTQSVLFPLINSSAKYCKWGKARASFFRIFKSVDGERAHRETLETHLDRRKFQCDEHSLWTEGRWTMVDFQSTGSFIVLFQ